MIPLATVDPDRPLVYCKARARQCCKTCSHHAVEYGRVRCKVGQGVPLAKHVMVKESMV